MEMGWTKEQQAAIDSRGQTLLLSAAAGSGKTAVLVERIIQRLLDAYHPVDITQLLVVTFTKAAAAEMRGRVASALMDALSQTDGKGISGTIERQLALLPSAHISTLHSFCQDVIRQYFYSIDMDPAFTIAGQEELDLLRRSVLEDVFLSYYEDDEKAAMLYPLADMFGTDRGDDALMDTIGHMYDYSRSMPWPQQWLDKAAAAYDVPDGAVVDDMPWCEPVKQQIFRVVKEKIAVYDDLLVHMKERPAFAAAMDQFALERQSLQDVLSHTQWDMMGKAVQKVEFPRLKALRNLSDEDKAFWAICKNARNTVKKDVTESLQTAYFTVPAQQWLDGIRDMAPIMNGLVQLTKDFATAYRQAKQDKGWIDFSDLEHYCLQILLDPQSTPDHPVPSSAAAELRQTYQEVLIDEYQDTNGVQELITRLVSTDNNRFMVGDIKQSIYRFRLADPRLFLEKYKSFSRDEKAGNRCIDLSKNFRSAANILEAVNEVFAEVMIQDATGMTYGKREKLYAGREMPTDTKWVGGPIEIHLLDTANTDADANPEEDNQDEKELTAFEKESRFIANRIVQLKESGVSVAKKNGDMIPLSYGHIVILMRSVAGKADVLLEALQAAGIPAYAEQNGGYFAASEVQVVLSLLRCIDNPEQDLPMAAVLRSAFCGMDEAGLAELRLVGKESLWQSLPVYIEQLEGSEKKSLQQFCTYLDEWRTFGRRHGVAELLQRIYGETAYYDYVGGMPGGSVRQANLKALYNRAGQYEAAGFRGIFRYLKFIDKMQDDGIDLAPAKIIGEGEDVVRIMSIHKSKGLEFPVVILADMGKSFNRQDQQALILFHNTLGIGIKQYDSQWRMFYPTIIWRGIAAQLSWENTAEEERILYVAMTRARDKLILTGHSSHMAKDWQRWQSGVNPALSHSYFDWVLSVLAGRNEFEPLAQSIENGQDIQCDDSLWSVFLHHNTAAPGVTEDILRQEPRLSCLHDGVTTHTAVPSWMEQSLSWQYPYHKAVLTPAKFSVSEIKRQYGLLQTEELSEENSLAVSAQPGHDEEEPFHQLPPWLAEETVTSGARRGTVFHKVMQYVPLRTDLTVQEVNSQLVQWEADGLFSAEEISWVDIPAVISFCQSTLGRRMAQSTDVRREYPFSVLFTGGNYLPDIESGEQILLQGVVDCLFREDDEWVLVDYKTDRLDTEEAFSKRYAIQLSLYKRAVEQISHIKIKDVYIYSFYLHAAIPLK